MKREVAAYILLFALFAGSLFNIHAMDKIIGELRTQVDAAYSSAQEGDFYKAKSQLEGAAEQWADLDGFSTSLSPFLNQFIPPYFDERPQNPPAGEAKPVCFRWETTFSVEFI